MRPSPVWAVTASSVGSAVAAHDQRMIARRLERARQGVEDGLALMQNVGDLAVDGLRRAHDLAAKGLADGLMAEADAEDRDFRAGLADQVEADARLVRGAGAGRQHDGNPALRQ